MIEVHNLTKRFGAQVAVDDLSFEVHEGRVTGFLGPNGSGKSTTMRCMVGLDRQQRGETRFDGKEFVAHERPLTQIGSLLDAGYVHPARTAHNHLRWLAASNGLPKSRVDEMLDMVGLAPVAKRKVKTYSLGMRQRLGIASVMLGDPHTLILDEPGNGLDPEGIRWVRDVLRLFAGQGKTVLVSSHLLSEMQLMANDLIVIGRGRLIDQCQVNEFVRRHATQWVRVRSPELGRLTSALEGRLRSVETLDGSTADLHGVTTEIVGEVAASKQVVLHELSMQTGSLEDAFLRATASTGEYAAHAVPPAQPGYPPQGYPPQGPPGAGWAPPAGQPPSQAGR
ncbi:ABC transporter ATP-binding protein [soil metagenome]